MRLTTDWSFERPSLTHWPLVSHISISKLTVIGSDNGLLPVQHQAIIWTSAAILLIRPKGTYFSEILSKIKKFIEENAFENVTCKVAPFCPGGDELMGLWMITDYFVPTKHTSLHASTIQTYLNIRKSPGISGHKVKFHSWWHHQMEVFSTLLAICAGNSPVTGEFPAQRPVMRSFDVFSLICTWINGWVNNRDAGDLRCHCAHYDVTVLH